jgi:hypothetical protein
VTHVAAQWSLVNCMSFQAVMNKRALVSLKHLFFCSVEGLLISSGESSAVTAGIHKMSSGVLGGV